MRYTTCTSIARDTPKAMVRTATKALERSDLVELRLDFLDPACVPDVLLAAKKHLARSVCTLRPKSEGGMFSGSERERISILKLVAGFDPLLVDVELETLKKNPGLARHLGASDTDILVSWHDFKRTPSVAQLERRLAEMAKLSKNVKMVTTARDAGDAARILGLYGGNAGCRLVAFAMGEEGRMSRLLCMHLGSPFTYVSLGRPVAPGQFSLGYVKRLEAES